MELGNLPEKRFKVETVKMIKEFGRRMMHNKKLEVFNKLENINDNQTEMKNIAENTLEGIKCRLNDREAEQKAGRKSSRDHW